MKVLIVGSTSVIGRAIGDGLAFDAEVKYIGRKCADYTWDLVLDADAPEIADVFDVVVFAAADFSGGIDDFCRSELVNVLGVFKSCRLATHLKAKHFVLLSSYSSTYQPGNPYYGIYALSKRHGEEVAELYCAEKNIALTILRPTQIYDMKGACAAHQKMLYSMIEQAQKGENIHLFGAHDAKRNYLYINDFVEVCKRVIQDRHVGKFDCAGGEWIGISEVSKMVLDVFGNGGSVIYLKDRPNIPDIPSTDDYRIYELTGGYPKTKLRDGLELIKSFREVQS